MAAGLALRAGNVNPAKPGEEVVPGQYLVKLIPGTTNSILTSRLTPGATLSPLQNDLYLLTGMDDEGAYGLAGQAAVEFVEPNRIRHTMLAAPNDASLSSQWALQTVHALEAWGVIPDRYLTASTTGGSRIRVAVLDSGIDCTHPDFANAGGSSANSAQGGQINFGLSQATVQSQAPIAGSCSWADDNGHGTHVAGIIAASAGNGQGVAGLAYPVELVAYKVLAANGSGDDSAIATAIMTAADAGARVISLSLGGSGYSQTLQSAINYAWERDALVVAAAGNSSSNALFFPADANYAVAVAASDNSNNRATFSNWGNGIDIAAPGNGILSTAPTYGVSLGIQNYASLSGTSMATPHVSALAGLLAMTTPNLPAAAILQRIQQSADSSSGGWDQNLGYGVINAFKALTGNLRPSSLGSITGQALDINTFPVASALVSAGGVTAFTDSSGLFRLGNLPPGTYTITVNSPHWSTQSITAGVAAGADTNVLVTVGGSYARFAGTVTDGGSPVAGAIVQALSGGLIKATATTDPGGQYTLWLPNGGGYDIRASAVGRQSSTVFGQFAGNGGLTGVNISLPKLGTIFGVVRDGAQRPISGAQIFIDNGSFSTGAVTDGNGNYSTIGMPAGNYSVTASAGGQPDTTVNGVSVNSGAASVNITMGGAIVAISVTPSSVNLSGGQTQQFSASVSGTGNTAVTWSINPNIGGISSSGFYIAPSQISANQSVTVTAVSAADPSKSASATVNLTAPPPPPPPPTAPVTPPVTITALSVSPSAVSVAAGGQQQFVASSNGAPTSAVNWSISPSVGSISSSGLYTAPSNVGSFQIVQITATSQVNPSLSSSTIIFLRPGNAGPTISISISPGSATLSASQSQQFTANVLGTFNSGVTWSLNPPIGSLSNGLYTAPSIIGSPTAVTVTATSVADSSKSASAIVNLLPSGQSVSVSLTPSTVVLAESLSQQFSASVSGTANTGVRWTVNPNVGFITSNGLYSAPNEVDGNQTVLVTATSVADPSKSASAVVTLVPALSLSISPQAATLSSSQSMQFSATANGAPNSSVTWVLRGPGSMSPSGMYTAPASINFLQLAVITAVSNADTRISSTTIVFLRP
jgi:subtilisin family serine protease